MTLRQALDLALGQSPDLILARLDQQKAREQVVSACDPFTPKVFGGSGAAWTTFSEQHRGERALDFPSQDGDGALHCSVEKCHPTGGCAKC